MSQYRIGDLARATDTRVNNVPDRIESRLGPRMYEGVELRVAVEADAEAVRLENPIEFGIPQQLMVSN
jgi:hypothetical protein